VSKVPSPIKASIVTLALLGLIACGGTDTPSSAAQTGEVIMKEWSVIAPKGLVAGKPSRLTVKNTGTAIHAIALDTGGDVLRTPVVDPGRSVTFDVPALNAGSYRMWCHISGHKEAGMETKLTIGGAKDEHEGMSNDEMEEAERAAVAAFPAKTEATGGHVLRPTLVDGVKVFEITAKAVSWEIAPGQFVDGYAYNGQIPGPQLRVKRGDRMRVVLHNDLPESTVVHFHGFELPNNMDGVPFITQDPIRPGATFTYEFTVKEGAGTYMYHSHFNALAQVGKGLLGSIVVEEPTKDWDLEQTLILGDGELGFAINGKGFPATSPIVAKKNQKVLLRFLNGGQQLHPMHLHGFHFKVVARDGRRIPSYVVDTLTVAPGERYDVVFRATERGIWALHCHILSHVEGQNGMYGMVTAVIVK
jgi:FtsP/CotA-like multicopper oxidase with cupredoxin domain